MELVATHCEKCFVNPLISETSVTSLGKGEDSAEATMGSTWLPDCQKVSSLILTSSEFS